MLAACSPKPVEPAPIRNPSGLGADAYPPRGWTWSPIPGPGLPRRYGVGSPPRVPRAEVMILPEREPAEAWFPVVNALTARGYTVWLADPQPAPLDAAKVNALRSQVIRGGSSGRLLVLGQGRGAVEALSSASGVMGMVLWSPIVGSAPYVVPRWEGDAMRFLGLGGTPLLGQKGWRDGDPPGDPLAQAWMKANPTLRPKPPTYGQIALYEAQIGALKPSNYLADLRRGVPVWFSGGDEAARAACAASSDCRPIAPGVTALIAAFDEATKEVTLGAPPPPVGKKRKPAPAA